MNEQDRSRRRGALEAVLFTAGGAVSVTTLSAAVDLPEDEVIKLLSEMQESYENEDRGIRIIRLEDAYQLCTKAEFFDTLVRVASRPQRPVLTEVMLEVLSIIAYRQPVTKGEIERLRGVSSDYSVNRLVEYGLVEEAGRQDSPGRPILFTTTEQFLRAFGISSVTELPKISEDLIAEATMEAIQEAGITAEEYEALQNEGAEEPSPEAGAPDKEAVSLEEESPDETMKGEEG
ncbi:MAG: SMC-Scp complex subunit ScpB [Lachnospiraceae bacterium]|nr:SMC-Scp complex subunit ScpB [Lachnospiraceae bacterium]